VPLLRFDEPLPHRPARVVVAGTSGAGKTTLAARIGEVLGAPHVEIDALFHGPGWTPRPTFLADVEQLTTQPAWVTEWQYDDVRALLAHRADLLVWLDLPRATVMRQVITRTVSRRRRRQRLWNGNVEPPLWTVLRDDEHIVRWAWTTHAGTGQRVRRLQQTRPDLAVVRLQSHRQAEAWLAGPLMGSTGTPPRRVVRP
jgi:adenylate kinase family enzyme